MPLERGLAALLPALTVLIAAIATSTQVGAQPAPPPRLLVWINGDKGYNGLQKVGDAFTAAT